MNELEVNNLEQKALRVKEHIIRMAENGGCFIGASLSCTELLVYLYTHFLNIDPRNAEDPGRDYFFLSKGHAVPALYGTLAETGFLDPARLKNHLTTADDIYWHPNPVIPGVEFYSGSLGHLLPVATGVAMDIKLRGLDNRVVVLTGDGELNEGSNWEACLIAAAYKLDNLVVVVDRNEFQANERTENLIPLEPLEQKFAAFNCAVRDINGHHFADLDAAFSELPFHRGRPNVIIAKTIRGHGLPGMEYRADRWFYHLSAEESELLLRELHDSATPASMQLPEATTLP